MRFSFKVLSLGFLLLAVILPSANKAYCESVLEVKNTRNNPYPKEIRKTLIAVFKCEREYPADKYFGHGDIKVVKSSIGNYREAEPKPLSRFGYRFNIKNPGKPHLAVIRYPDDKRRYMCIMDGTSYDLTTGVFTDYAQPLTGKMQQIEQIFWPRWNDCTLIFMTWGTGEPAAVATVEIYELENLPAAETGFSKYPTPRRELGIQYEDPCGISSSEGAMSHEEWVERVISYGKYSGQNLLVYPIVWYHGPRFPSGKEPSDHFECVVGKDRKQYVRWTTQPADWVAYTLKRFGEEGLRFRGAMTMLRLGSLMERMNTDSVSVANGKDTINNVLKNGMIQSGTQDWTPLYNSRNYPKVLEFYAKGLDMGKFPWVYGEKTGQPYHGGPIFNPLHPVVQKTILDFIADTAERYKNFKAFEGFSLNIWNSSILWFGSLDSGYDDYTVGLFVKETGIKVPGDPKDPDRFHKRYEFLTGPVRPAWINWRCAKIHDLICRIDDTIKKARPDLTLNLTFWTETTIPQILGPLSASHQLFARAGNAEFFREGGMDVSLYKDNPDIGIDLHLEPQRDRGGWLNLGADTPLDQATMFRDFDFLDEQTKDRFKALSNSGCFIFNGWVEAWGEQKWFPCEKNDSQAAKFAYICGKPAEGIFRTNSEYPKDNFWYKSQLRITPAFQSGDNFLEHYAYAVAEYDAMRITRGGLFLDKAHTSQILNFALAYGCLPAEKFQTVGIATDPVAVRTLVKDGKRYFYAVNRDYYPIGLEITFDREVSDGIELSSGAALGKGAKWILTLDPYQLRSFTISADAKITGFKANPPSDIASEIDNAADLAIKAINQSIGKGYMITGAPEMAAEISAAKTEGKLAWLRRAENSYIVKKCLEITR